MSTNFANLDYQSIQAEGAKLASGDAGALNSWFGSEGIDFPIVVWNPKTEDLVTDPVRFLFKFWNGKKLDGEVGMRSAELDPLDLLPAMGYIMVLDVLDGGRDFRYRLYGSKIAEIAKFDSTGLKISETKAHPLMKAFFSTVYEAVLQRQEPIYTQHNPPPNLTIATWHRIVLPLHDGDGNLDRFLVGNVPTPFHDAEERSPTPFR